MTPVQLPEVPASLDTVRGMVRGERDWVEPCDDYYTADQLRAYATECVLLDRIRTKGAIQQAVNMLVPPKMTEHRAEYWKAGARGCIFAVNFALGYTTPPAPVQAAPQEGECVWDYDEDTEAWNGTCGSMWQFTAGDPDDNDIHYCPKCGKRCTLQHRGDSQEVGRG